MGSIENETVNLSRSYLIRGWKLLLREPEKGKQKGVMRDKVVVLETRQMIRQVIPLLDLCPARSRLARCVSGVRRSDRQATSESRRAAERCPSADQIPGAPSISAPVLVPLT